MTRRAALAWAFAGAAVVAAVVAVRFAGGATALLGVDQLIAGPTSALTAFGGVLPFGYAFAAGMLAAINPCGFALLPAYLGLAVGTLGPGASPLARARRAVSVALTMTGAFVLAFGVAGVLVAAAGSAAGPALPVIGLAVGLCLAAGGAYLLGGGALFTTAGDRVANRLAGAARAPGHRGYAAYGLAYAAASLGCALPIFLSVVGVATASHDPARSAGQFALYGLGMGFVVTALTIVAALLGGAALRSARRAGGRLIEAAGGALLVLTGAYVTAYWAANLF